MLGLVIRDGLRLAAVGVALGLPAALALTRLMETQLYGVSSSDPATFAVTSLVLLGVASAASFVPARRAMNVDPIVALRCE